MLSIKNRITVNSLRIGIVGLSGKICRFFTTLVSASSQYITIPTYTSSGNFIITFKAILGNAGNTDNLLGQTALTTNGLSLSTNVLVLTIDSSVVTFTVAITKDSKLRDYGVRLEGNDFILSEDGVDLETITDAVAAAKTLTLTSIARSNTNYLNALISDVKLDGKRFYKLDEDFSTTSTAIDSGSDNLAGTAISISSSDEYCSDGSDWIGVELMTNFDFALGATGWSVFGSPIFSTGEVDLAVSNDAVYQNVLELSTDYVLNYESIEDSADGMTTNRGGSAMLLQGLFPTKVRDYEFDLKTESSGALHFPMSVNNGGVKLSFVSLNKMLKSVKPKSHVIGDSFVTVNIQDFAVLCGFIVGRNFDMTSDGVAGTTLAQQKIRFDSTPQFYDDVLIIMDGGLTDTSANAISAIDGMVAHLTHDNWVWVQPSPAEDIEGSPARIAWNADVAAIAAHVGVDHYVECLTALKAGNDGSANDLQDVADNIVPRSLRVDAIHENYGGAEIRASKVMNFIKSQGW